jgi:heat shock protein HslJ
MLKSIRGVVLAAVIAAPVGEALSADAGGASPPPRRPADPVLVRALQDHVWTLRSATGAGGAPLDALSGPDARFVLRVDGARLGVQGGCNAMTGGWRLLQGDLLRVGKLASTMKACDPPLMAADRAMADALAAPLRVRVEPGEAPGLQLVAEDGRTLGFVGQRTPRSLYGAPKRVFLEVAPQRVACTPSPMPPTTCLQVRELRFDDKGLRVGEPGPWRAYYGVIQGFEHQPGVRNVLRIDRYTRPRPPADASAHVDVLDLVVESESVGPK